GPLDRMLGFVFGAARGILICIVAAVFANFLIAPSNPMLKDSKSYPSLLSAGDYVIGLLPPDIEQQFRDFLARGGSDTDQTQIEEAPADGAAPSAEPAPSA